MKIMSHEPKNAYRGLYPHDLLKRHMIYMIYMICDCFERFLTNFGPIPVPQFEQRPFSGAKSHD
jgi:hypothetical protein